MNHESLTKYVGKKVKLSLENGFWYKAKIINVNEDTIDFIDIRGHYVSVHPKTIMMIEEIDEWIFILDFVRIVGKVMTLERNTIYVLIVESKRRKKGNMRFEIPYDVIDDLEENHIELFRFLMKYQFIEKEGRYISREKRYNILKRQKWNCNLQFPQQHY